MKRDEKKVTKRGKGCYNKSQPMKEKRRGDRLRMKKRILSFFLAICLAMIPMTAMAAESQGAVSRTAAEPENSHGAPAYGTKAATETKRALYEEIRRVTRALQPAVDAAAPLTASHNVKTDNYSDADAMGLIYETQGSGVILAMDQNAVYISTAAHCLKHENTEVEFADGTRCAGTVVYRNPAKDVGFIVVETEALTQRTLEAISPAPGMSAQEAGKSQGDLLFAVSSSDGPNSLALPGILDQYSVEYPNNPQQDVLQFYSDISYGSSGGALYTLEGIWTGSVSGGDTYGICWAVPYGDIVAEFNSWLTMMAMQQAATAA